VIRLATRVSLGGGKESIVRLVLTALGVALGVALLLFATVAFHALHEHDVRQGWTETSSQNIRPAQDEATTDPLIWRLRHDRFDGRDIIRVDVAAEGPRAPVPNFLSRLPGPGEIAASPSMARLMRNTDPAQLAQRYPGRVTLTVGKQGLASSDQLVIFVGHTPAELRALGYTDSVRSIEAAPISHDFSRFLRIVLVVGALALLVPIIVFVSTATRLAAARREQRLAAMRLAGATPQQTGVVAAVEAALAAIAGTALGVVLFFVVRPFAARVPFDGHSFYVSDLRLSLPWTAVVVIGVPMLCVAAALLSLRRVRISPLGVTRQVARRRPTALRLGLLAGALLFFFVALVISTHTHGSATPAIVTIGTAFFLIIGAIVACGPWLTAVVARVMGRVGRRAPSLLAARRLQANPSAGFRAISGLILAVFVASLVSALASSTTGSTKFKRTSISPSTVATATFPVLDNGSKVTVTPDTVTPSGLGVAPATRLLRQLAATRGVHHIVDVRALPANVQVVGPQKVLFGVGVIRCTDSAVFNLPPCVGTTAINVDAQLGGADFRPPRLSAPIPVGALDALPLSAVAVTTNGRTPTVERVRTQLQAAIPGAEVVTGRDLNSDNRQQLSNIERLANVALLLTLVIAGCSLAVSVAGGLVERKRPFALLRLAGMPLRQLHRVVFAEAAAPLLVVAAASAALGFAVCGLMLEVIRDAPSFRLPTFGYWAALGAGLGLALLIVGATLPLLDRLTSLETARFE
jgi:ABC-type lipoprotein release transport system permease subunit